MNLIEALKKTETYNHPVKDITIIETAAHIVALTGTYAYKVKKPIDLGFLDFTTPEKRKILCYRELKVNKRLCPDIYLDVVTINASDEGLKINGPGPAVEHAVKMVQLSENDLMSEKLKQNEVSVNDVKEIAAIVANFHKIAETSEDIQKYGSVEQIKANWDQNFDQTKNVKGNVISEEDFEFIKNKVNNFIQLNKELLLIRQKTHVKRCHGDLHTKNIFLADKPYIFDAIEFNDIFPSSDTAAEVAFLCMDLEAHHRQDLSKIFLQKYLEVNPDPDLIKLLDFYKCYRAYIRAKIETFQLENDSSAKERAKTYFKLALNYSKQL